jgi:hypothetical protein
MDPQALYQQLGVLIAERPDLIGSWKAPATQRWLGRAFVLVEAAGNVIDITEFRTVVTRLATAARDGAVIAIDVILHRTLARAELAAPVAARGAFIAAGAEFDALIAVGKVLGAAKSRVLVVDPYMDAEFLSDFAPMAGEGVQIDVLSDERTVKSAMEPAARRWVDQWGNARPLRFRLAAPRTLHDRLILSDEAEAWVLTQSFKDLAARSPASLVRSDPETSALKVVAYGEVWGAAREIVAYAPVAFPRHSASPVSWLRAAVQPCSRAVQCSGSLPRGL